LDNDNVKQFPCGKYGRQMLRFYPAPFKAPLRAFAVLVFPWQGDKVLVADIAGRGWCIPSGRVEPNEASEDAVRREAREEAGAILEDLQYIGCYQISHRSEVRWADCFSAHVAGLTDIEASGESKGRQFASLDELPEMYHLWNELTSQVFVHSRKVMRRIEARRSA
jgi:8-oxo-dGTP diphosphatase